MSPYYHYIEQCYVSYGNLAKKKKTTIGGREVKTQEEYFEMILRGFRLKPKFNNEALKQSKTAVAAKNWQKIESEWIGRKLTTADKK